MILQICEGGGFKRAVLKKMLFIFFSEKDELEHKFASRVIFEAQWEMNGSSRDIASYSTQLPNGAVWIFVLKGSFFYSLNVRKILQKHELKPVQGS